MLLCHALARSSLPRHRFATSLSQAVRRQAAVAACGQHRALGQERQRRHGRSVASPLLQSQAHLRNGFFGCRDTLRSVVTQQLSANGSASSSSPQPKANRVRRVLVTLLKIVALWLPASLFWLSMLAGGPLFDLRTDEEISEDENEVRRLERFFGVDGLSEAEYISEWTAKEQALSQIVEKILRSQRFSDCLTQGPDKADENEAAEQSQKPASWSASQGKPSEAAANSAFEVSYVLPPPADEDALGDAEEDTHARTSIGSSGVWQPRLMIASRDGSLALVTLQFEYVVKGKDREERWACTILRAELVATTDGDYASEQIFDLHGPAPHGVRYMRL